MTIIRLREEAPQWGWKTGTFGYRAFCLGWWAIGR